MYLTRAQFRDCIEKGIAHAGDLLTDTDRANLRNYGATASSCGTNYSTFCPAAACGLAGMGDEPIPTKAVRFAEAFDDAWCSILQPGFPIPPRLRVR